MSTTLITSLGAGMYKDGYRQTTYRFPDGSMHTSALFLDAILAHSPDITRVILVGTQTSAWDILCENDPDIWTSVKEQCESSGGLRDTSHNAILACLKKRHPDISFVLKIHVPSLDAPFAEAILDIYNSIPDAALPSGPVIFDITHGFRSMPLLIWQALQINADKFASRPVSLVYGEYIESEKVSRVRDLSAYWGFSEIAKAKYAFFNKLDGTPLVPHLQDLWPEGAKTISRLSGIVACNFALQLPECLRQLDNALKAFPASAPRWAASVRDFLLALHARLGKASPHETVLEYARFLTDQKLHTQAVIALQIAVELAIAGQNHGDYDWWQTQGKPALSDAKKRLPRDTADSLSRLESLRNQIAHGGYKNAFRGGGFPNAENVPSTLDRCIPAVEKLFASL
jgi:CRISPR-associated Csx2 family protein